MSDRFNKSRWSKSRLAIDALAVGESKAFPGGEYFNCKSSVDRFNDAYDGERVYEVTGGKSAPVVKRIL